MIGRRRRIAVVICVIAVLAIGAMGGAAAAEGPFLSTEQDEREEHDPVRVTYDVDFLPDEEGVIEVTIEIDATETDVDGTDRLGFDFRGELIKIRDSDGINPSERSWETFNWYGDAERASITFRYDPTVENAHFDGLDFGAGDEWALVHLDVTDSTTVGVAETFLPDGTQGEQFTVFGEFEEYEIETHGQEIRLIVPDAADLSESPDEVLESLAYESRHLRVGSRNEELFVVATTDPLRGGGLAAWNNREVVVSEDSSLLANTWGHEYVHTRQDRGHARDAEWIVEAEARYYQYLTTYKQGHMDVFWMDEFGLFRSWLSIDEDVHEDAALVEPDSWAYLTNYNKGALVLAALDAEIREATDGERTYQDVMRELNDRSRVTHDDLVEATENVTGESMEEFFERYVAGTEIPAVPDDPSLYEQGEHEFDVAFVADAAVESRASSTGGDQPVVAGESAEITYSIENVGLDPSVTPRATLELPGGWTSDSETTLTTVEFAPGEVLEATATVEVPVDATGTEEVSVTVSDADGFEERVDVAVIAVAPPEAHLDADEVVLEDEPVRLDASESRVSGAIETIQWDLTGDGEFDKTTSDTVLETHLESGERTVTVRVVDEYGLESEASVSITVTDRPRIEPRGDETVIAGDVETLAVAVENDVGSYEVHWELPDGTERLGESIEHAFEPGYHRIGVRVEDEYGANVETSVELIATDVPVLSIDAPDVAVAGEPTTMITSVENDMGRTDVRWEFPDGTVLEGRSIERTFEPGSHEITVTVEDEYGASAARSIEVSAAGEPNLSVFSPGSITEGEPATVSGTVSAGVDRGTIRAIPPGGEPVETELEPDERGERSFEHEIDGLAAGTHDVEIVVETEHGFTVAESVTVTVEEEDTIDRIVEGQPGFGIVPAAVALVGLALFVRRRS